MLTLFSGSFEAHAVLVEPFSIKTAHLQPAPRN